MLFPISCYTFLPMLYLISAELSSKTGGAIMSLPSVYKSLYQRIKAREAETGISLSVEARMELMRLYLDRITIPFLSEENILGIIEDFPRPGLPSHRKMPRFSSGERRKRAQRSEAVRGEFLKDLVYETDNDALLSNYNEKYASGSHPENKPVYSRQVQRLFRQVPENAGIEQNAVQSYNRMIARLFDDNPLNKEEYLQERIRDSHRSPEEEAQVLEQERSKVIVERITSCSEVLRNLDAMTDESLSPAELASNYHWVRDAIMLCMEIDKFKETYSFTREQTAQLEDLRSLQYFCDIANSRLHAIANPAYEYLDLESIDDYVIYNPVERNIYDRYTERAMRKDIVKWRKDHEEKVLRDYIAAHPDMTPFLMDEDTPINWFRHDKVKDAFEVFAEDTISIQNNRGLLREEIFQSTVQNFAFDDDAALCLQEVPGADSVVELKSGAGVQELQNNRPVIFEKNSRVVILTPGKGPGNGVTDSSPEELFNFTLRSENMRLKQKLENADPLWMKSSPEFRAMKESLAAVSELSPLGTETSLNNAFSKYRELLRTSDAYLSMKKDGQTEDTERSSREKERVQAAREISVYAKTKLKELELVEAARNTLVRFRGKSPEEQRRMAQEEDIIAENARAFREKRMDQQSSSDRSLRPFHWMQEQMNAIYKEETLPGRVYNVMQHHFTTLNSFNNGKILYQNNTMLTGESAACLCGSMIAAELILQERSRLKTPGVSGPVEDFFANSETSLHAMLRLGKQAMTAIVGRDYMPVQGNGQSPYSGSMTGDQLKEFIETFQPKELSAQFTDSFLNTLGVSPILQQLTGQYLNTVKPLRGEAYDACEQAFITFAREEIVAPMQAHLTVPAAGDILSAQDSRKLLANGVIYNLIQLERARPDQTAPGYLETELKNNPDGIRALAGQIMESADFRNLLQANARVDGTVHVRDMAKLLDQITTPTLVRNTMRSLTASCAKNLETLKKKAAPAAVPVK